MPQSKDTLSPVGKADISSRNGFWYRFVRNGEWFTFDRLGFSAATAALMASLVMVILFYVPTPFMSANGTFMTDYMSFWLAGQQALEGTPEVAYQLEKFVLVQHQLSQSDTIFAFFYPPTFQMLQIPYALLPLNAAHLVFVASTTFVLWLALRAIMGNGLWAACLLAVPACLNNAFHGQNGALTAALFALFLLGLERKRPVLAGIALGALTMKPQLGPLAPIALVACANWRCFISASVTTLALVALSTIILGGGVWIAFWEQIPTATEVMQTGYVDWEKMISVYSALRLLGMDHTIALALQVCITLAVVCCVWMVWRRNVSMHVKAPVLLAGALMATPFALAYDFTLLLVPCAFLIREGMERRFLAYEQVLLAVFIVLSASTGVIALSTGLPIAPLLSVTILFLGLRRYLHKCDPIWLKHSQARRHIQL